MNPLRPDILNVMTLFTYILSFLGNAGSLDLGLLYLDSSGCHRGLVFLISCMHACIHSFIHSLIYLFIKKEFIISFWISGEVWALALPLRRVTGVRNHAPRVENLNTQIDKNINP